MQFNIRKDNLGLNWKSLAKLIAQNFNERHILGKKRFNENSQG